MLKLIDLHFELDALARDGYAFLGVRMSFSIQDERSYILAVI